MNKPLIFIVLIVVAFASLIPIANAQRKQVLGRSVASNQLVSFDSIDHSSFDTLLQKYVDEDGMVNYKDWGASSADRESLLTYINSLSAANPNTRSSKESALAFWINSYNAVTIEGILQVYPTTSIRNHTAKVAGYNIWHHLKLNVAGSEYSLNDIEHNVLRKMDEPRIHFAIVCASIGCPRLLNQAYVAENLEEQLQVNTRDFFSRSQNLQYDSASSTLQLSSLINWFADDFGKDSNGQVTYLAPYFPKQVQTAISTRGFNISYLDYDWNINEQKTQVSQGSGSNKKGSNRR